MNPLLAHGLLAGAPAMMGTLIGGGLLLRARVSCQIRQDGGL